MLLVGTDAPLYGFVLPYPAPRGLSRRWQVVGLTLLTLGLFGGIFASTGVDVGLAYNWC